MLKDQNKPIIENRWKQYTGIGHGRLNFFLQSVQLVRKKTVEMNKDRPPMYVARYTDTRSTTADVWLCMYRIIMRFSAK